MAEILQIVVQRAQSVQRLATCWMVRGSNPSREARFSTPVQTGPGAHPASYTMGTGSFLGVKRQGRGFDHPSHLAPRLKEEWSAILLHVWTFVACCRVKFTFTFTFYVF